MNKYVEEDKIEYEKDGSKKEGFIIRDLGKRKPSNKRAYAVGDTPTSLEKETIVVEEDDIIRKLPR
ncbi:12894_t:CDS:2 [Funneliformis caledonium]|uniref:12894_t:CDS:1 n=1 Tax=Funneliformis caledonium TaxID=1117310 RepID=A0A9N9AVI7_9GLOM|nr:12894_t:CDS:2 [Funneliformis caledonium]